MPAPGIKLGMLRLAQADIAVPAHQSEQKPDLLLPAILSACFTPHPVLRYVVAQPFACAPEYLYMARIETNLFLEFAVHGLLGRLTALDPDLRELPSMF